MKDFSVACAVMNREDMLKISLQSWLQDQNIKDISIVDWNSRKNLKHLEYKKNVGIYYIPDLWFTKSIWRSPDRQRQLIQV